MFLILPTPIWIQLRDPFDIVKVNCEDLRKFVNPEWTNSHNKTLQQASSIISVRLLDFLQYTLIRLVQRIRQFIERTSDTWWKTVP